jgi:hypothetical protein
MSDVPKITREQLYQRLWTTPIVKLAKDLGYSYPELTQICTLLNLPRPAGGYWYRLAHGGASEQVPLPPTVEGMPAEIELRNRTLPPEVSPAGSEPPEATTEVPKVAAAAEKTLAAPENVSQAKEGPVKVTRQELYQAVWRTTLRKLVKELGTTHLELVRACEEMKVSRPDRSYWSRVQLGLPVQVLPLVVPEPGTPLECLLRRPGGPRPGVQTSDVSAQPVPEEAAVPVDQAPKGAGIPEPIGKPPVSAEAVESPAVAADAEPLTWVEYTREQLHEAIWTTPCLKLAAKLGISDVALAKTCRRLGVPRPPRGYWARVEAGEKLRKAPLPAPKPGQDQVVHFNVADNLVRRQEWAAHNLLGAGGASKLAALELSAAGGELHPIAERHRRALQKAKPDELGCVVAQGKDLFRCEVSSEIISRLVGAMDAIVCELEDRDYEFHPGDDEYAGLQIVGDQDRVGLRWTEAKVEIQKEPTDLDKRKPSWTWQLTETKPSGALSLEVSASDLRGKRKWTEGEGRSLEELLGIVVEKVEATFRGFEAQRQREAEWARQREEEAKRAAERRIKEAEAQAQEARVQKERERAKRHGANLTKIVEARRNNLAVAAQQWIEAQGVNAFIDFCEARWRQAGGGELSPVQSDWLDWARAESAKLGPFAKGYPDPLVDGKLDASTIPVGGPYPEAKVLETLTPEAPAAVSPPPETGHVQIPQPPEQFPFWLLQRQR